MHSTFEKVFDYQLGFIGLVKLLEKGAASISQLSLQL